MKKFIFVLLLLFPVNVYAQWDISATKADSTDIKDGSISGADLVDPLRMPTHTQYLQSLFASKDITVGDDVLNLSGSIKFVASDNDQASIDINTSDQLVMTGNNGAGTLIGADFAGLLVDNGGSTTITTVQIFEQMTTFDTDMPEAISNGAHGTDDIVIGATGNYYVYFAANATSAANNKEYSFNAFQITATTTVVAFVTTGTPSVISSEGHGYSKGNRVKIKDVGGATGVNNRIYTVAGVDAGDSTYTLDAEDGTDVNGTGFGVWDSDGTAQLATKLEGVHRTRKFGTGSDNGAFSAASYEALTLNNTLELWVLGITDATNITVKDYTFGMERKN